jgi:hypothetical protein
MQKNIPLAVMIVVGANIVFGLATVVILIATLGPAIAEMKNYAKGNAELVNSNIGWIVNFFYIMLFSIITLMCWTSYYLLKGRNWMRWIWVVITTLVVIIDVLKLESGYLIEVTQFFWVDGFLIVSILLLFTRSSNQYFKSEHSYSNHFFSKEDYEDVDKLKKFRDENSHISSSRSDAEVAQNNPKRYLTSDTSGHGFGWKIYTAFLLIILLFFIEKYNFLSEYGSIPKILSLICLAFIIVSSI